MPKLQFYANHQKDKRKTGDNLFFILRFIVKDLHFSGNFTIFAVETKMEGTDMIIELLFLLLLALFIAWIRRNDPPLFNH